MAVMFTEDVPQAVERIAKSTYTPEELAQATAVLKSWMTAGVQKDYATARANHQVVGDGQPYAAQKEGEDGRRLAQKAANRFKTLLGHAITQAHAEKSGRVVIITGRHPKAANAFGWAMYWAAYADPKPRKPKAPAAEAPVAAS